MRTGPEKVLDHAQRKSRLSIQRATDGRESGHVAAEDYCQIRTPADGLPSVSWL